MKKEEKEKRVIAVATKLTEEEAEKVRELARAKGITTSELLRRAVLNLPIPEKASPERLAKRNEVFRRYLYEINRIGTNLNQVAKRCNQYREVDVLVLERIIEIERTLKELVEKIYEELSE